jgi:hypothetical protein
MKSSQCAKRTQLPSHASLHDVIKRMLLFFFFKKKKSIQGYITVPKCSLHHHRRLTSRGEPVANLTRTSSFYSDRGSAGQQPDLPAAETFG